MEKLMAGHESTNDGYAETYGVRPHLLVIVSATLHARVLFARYLREFV